MYYNGVSGIMDEPIVQNAYAKFNTTLQVWSKIESNDYDWLSSSSVVNLEDIVDYCKNKDFIFHPQIFHFSLIFEGMTQSITRHLDMLETNHIPQLNISAKSDKIIFEYWQVLW